MAGGENCLYHRIIEKGSVSNDSAFFATIFCCGTFLIRCSFKPKKEHPLMVRCYWLHGKSWSLVLILLVCFGL